MSQNKVEQLAALLESEPFKFEPVSAGKLARALVAHGVTVAGQAVSLAPREPSEAAIRAAVKQMGQHIDRLTRGTDRFIAEDMLRAAYVVDRVAAGVPHQEDP